MITPSFLKRSSFIIFCIALLCAITMSRFAMAEETTVSCVTPTEQEVASWFTQWNDALKTKNPDTVTALYAKNGVLLATVSNDPRVDHTGIHAYFVDFLKKEPSGVIDSSVIRTGCNWASNSGIYTFQLLNDEGKKMPVKARYTYVYERINGKWLIVSHHSSVLPE